MSSEASDACVGEAARAPAAPPGPRGNPFFGATVKRSRRDPLNFMTGLARDYGDVCAFRVGFERIFFVNHPDYVREVFVNHYDKFLKGGGGGRAKRFLGEGVLLSEGERHRQGRRLQQPAFHRQRLNAYAAEMVAYGERAAGRWRDGEVLDIWPEMLRLTLGVVGKTLFSVDVESEADDVGQAMKAAASRYRAFKLPFAKLLESLPLSRMLWFHRGKERLRHVALRLIEERRQSGRDHGDLLSMLLLAEDAEDGGRSLTPEQVWDEALTIFIAGYDTIATALMWTFYLLSEHPEAEARLHAELEEVLGRERPAGFEDLRRLAYTEQVLAESMRLYPPAWRLMRRAIGDFRVGQYVIPAGSLVVVCQYAMHRNPLYFPDPERFDPERFAPAARAARPQYSYFPFGGGPRRCLGEGFALTEGVLILATLARRWRMRLVPGHPVEVFPEHLLRARHGMLMKLEAR